MKKNLDMTEGKPISLLWAFTCLLYTSDAADE